MKPLTFAIDFDDTLTACPTLWRPFIEQAKLLGHRVFCVTARRDTDENREDIDEWMIDNAIELHVIYCGLASKIATMERRGIDVAIWIDDDPIKLVKGH
jgi:hypothetical protein